MLVAHTGQDTSISFAKSSNSIIIDKVVTGCESALPEVDVRGIKQELCGYRYVPGPVLRAGVNEVIMLEVEAAPSDPTGDHTTHTCSVPNAFWQRL